jgi:hypothetical protein
LGVSSGSCRFNWAGGLTVGKTCKQASKQSGNFPLCDCDAGYGGFFGPHAPLGQLSRTDSFLGRLIIK